MNSSTSSAANSAPPTVPAHKSLPIDGPVAVRGSESRIDHLGQAARPRLGGDELADLEREQLVARGLLVDGALEPGAVLDLETRQRVERQQRPAAAAMLEHRQLRRRRGALALALLHLDGAMVAERARKAQLQRLVDAQPLSAAAASTLAFICDAESTTPLRSRKARNASSAAASVAPTESSSLSSFCRCARLRSVHSSFDTSAARSATALTIARARAGTQSSNDTVIRFALRSVATASQSMSRLRASSGVIRQALSSRSVSTVASATRRLRKTATITGKVALAASKALPPADQLRSSTGTSSSRPDAS